MRFCLGAAAAFVALGTFADGVCLKPGETEVVIARNASKVVRFAADEMTNFLSRAFGASVPVVTAPIAGKASIVLGENEWSKAEGIDPSSKPRDTYFIRTAAGRVFIVGTDSDRASPMNAVYSERGTLHGVYAFLEDYAGCRFYFPGELGEVVPRRDRIVVPDCDIAVTPSFLIRRYYTRDGRWFEGGEREEKLGKQLNWLRTRASTFNIPCCHGTIKMGLNDRFAKSHPEYFALKSDGSRHTHSTVTGRNRHGSLCFSSGVRDAVYDYCVEQFAKGVPFVDIMPNDALPMCHCENCAKLIRLTDTGKGWDGTDLIWGYTKYVAEKLIANGVPGNVTQMAYSQYNRIPDFPLSTNICVMVAQGGPWSLANPEVRARQYANIRGWAKKVGHPIWIWTYPHKYGALNIPGLPDVAPRAWGEYYKALDDDIVGTFAESETDKWIYHYLNYYVFSRVMWNAKTDVDAVLDEHYRLMFGAAAAPMAEFYEAIERKWVNEIAGSMRTTAVGPVYAPPTESEIWTRIYGEAEVAALGKLLDRAASLVEPGSLEARRIAFFRREYHDAIADGLVAYRDKRRKIESFVWRAADGKPIELRPFKPKKKAPPEEFVKTYVTVSRTADDLVVTYDCEDNRMDDVAAIPRSPDDPDLWRDAGVEIFLNPNADRRTYYHLMVNAEGSVADSRGVSAGKDSETESLKAWDSGATAKSERRADGWTLTVRIPLKALGEVKDAFPAEFARNRVTKSGRGYCRYNWSPYVFGFNSVSEYGTVDLGGRLAPSAAEFPVTDYGAKPDGTKCTEAFAKAIAACAEAGGGRVTVPAGTWFTGPIHLKGNVELHLGKGAVVEFSDDPKDCLPAVPSSWEGLECLNLSPLVYAYCCTNVAITGKGTLRPRMAFWREMMKESKTDIMGARAILYKWGSEDYPVEKRDITKAHPAVLRPQCVQFNRCKGVRMEDVRIEDSPFWTIHLFMSEDVTIRRIDVCAHGFNNDGVDIEMTRNVLIEDSVFDQGDDGLVFKSGRNRDAWRVGRPTENVEARNCRFKTVGSLVGVGSELSGGVRNVYVHDCTIENACNLFYVKTNHRRGGFVENIRMENVKVTEVSQVLAVDTDVLYQWRKLPEYETRLTPISGLHMKNVACARARTGVNINGDFRLPVRDVYVENVRIGRVQDFLSRVTHADDVDLSGLSCGEQGKVETRWDADFDPTAVRSVAEPGVNRAPAVR